MSQDHSIAVNTDAWRAVAELYHAYFTGIILFAVSLLGPRKAEELVFEIFCRQRRERFLPGLKKLGIEHLPPAVAAAQYHYLSNHIGGVPVEFMPETDRNSWIRYSAPRWIWAGTALCGIPPEIWRPTAGLSCAGRLPDVDAACIALGIMASPFRAYQGRQP